MLDDHTKWVRDKRDQQIKEDLKMYQEDLARLEMQLASQSSPGMREFISDRIDSVKASILSLKNQLIKSLI